MTRSVETEAGATETESTSVDTTETSMPTSTTGTSETSVTTTTAVDSTSETSTCPAGVVAGDTSVEIAVGSLTRSYVLHVPTSYDPDQPAPLVLDFHGAGGSGWDQLSVSPYPAVTDPEGVVMVFPDGVNGPIGNAWNIGPCCVPGVDDLAFVDALLSDITERVCVDAARIYAVGVLTGGGMVHHLACQRSEAFAAVAPAAFDLVEETVDDCTPTAPVSVIAFRGTADPKVPYEGGSASLVPNMPVTFLGAVNSFERWASIDGCTDEPTPPDVRGCSAYTQCRDGAEVVLCTKKDGQSDPGDANVAWPLLKRHTR